MPRGPAARERLAPLGHDALGLARSSARAVRLEPPPIQWAVPPATPKRLDPWVGRGDAAHARLAARDGPLRHADFAARDACSDKAPLRLRVLPRTAVVKSASFAKTAAEDTPAQGPAPVRALSLPDTPEAARPGGASPAPAAAPTPGSGALPARVRARAPPLARSGLARGSAAPSTGRARA